MYELQQVGSQSYYINCPAKIGVYVRSEHEVYLIDSGNDKEAAKKVLKIKSICKTPQTTDGIITEVFRTFGLTMTIEQYVLVGSTVRSYLSWMKDRGVIDYSVDNSMLLWKTVE